MRNIFCTISAPICGALVGFVLTIFFMLAIIIVIPNVNVRIQYYSEKIYLNKITARWSIWPSKLSPSYTCDGADYDTLVRVYNKETETFYSYDNFFKINNVPILPHVTQFMFATLDIFIVNFVHLFIFIFVSLPLEVSRCNNYVVGILYIVLISCSCACIVCLFTFCAIAYCLCSRE